jgi:DNA-binding LacI/PurR family transcriptional regulator
MIEKRGSRARVEEYLLEKLRECEAGERLPSIRQIKQDCGVSQSVVDKVIMQLLIENRIKVMRPAGLFKAEQPLPKIKILDFKHSQSHGFYRYLITELLYVLASHNRQVEVIPVSDSKALDEIVSSTQNVTYITISLDWQDFAVVRSCERIVHLIPNFVEPAPPSLIIDDAQLVEAQLKMLTANGHRKIAYLHQYDENHYSRAQNARWDAFHHLGFSLKLDFNEDYLVFMRYMNEQEKTEAVDKLFQLPEPPTAILLASDDMVVPVYQGIKRNGLEPGRDIAVLGTDNREWGGYTVPQLSSVGFSLRAGIEQMMDMVKRIESGEPGDVLTFPLEIAERQSVNNIKKV